MGKMMRDGGNGESWIFTILRRAWRSFVDEARAAPAAAWRRWSVALLLGYAASGGVAVLATSLARRWHHRGLDAWDERVLEKIVASPFTFAQGLWFEAWGSSAFLVPMLLVVVVLLVRSRFPFRASTLAVAYVLNKGLVLGAWQLWDRARPDSVADGVAAPGLHSFPSGHAVNAVVLFGLLAAMWWISTRNSLERAAAVLLMGGVVALTCLGRVRLGTHWPSDILAGLIIGSVWLAGLLVAMVWAERAAVRH